MSENSIELVKTVQIHNAPITASCLSKEGIFMGIGGCDGASKVVNLRYLDIESKNHNHEFVVKGISFTTDSRFLVTGTPEMGVDLLQNLR